MLSLRGKSMKGVPQADLADRVARSNWGDAFDLVARLSSADRSQLARAWANSSLVRERGAASRALRASIPEELGLLRGLLGDKHIWVAAEAFAALADAAPDVARPAAPGLLRRARSGRPLTAVAYGVVGLAAHGSIRERSTWIVPALLRFALHDRADIVGWGLMGLSFCSRVPQSAIAVARRTLRRRAVELRMDAIDLLVVHAPEEARGAVRRELELRAAVPEWLLPHVEALRDAELLAPLLGYWGALTRAERRRTRDAFARASEASRDHSSDERGRAGA
jgi:hypothetical protein